MKLNATLQSPRCRLAMVGGLLAALAAGALLWSRKPAVTIAAVPPAVAATAEHIPPGTPVAGTPSASPPEAADPPTPRLPRATRLTFDDVGNPQLFGLSPELLAFVDIQSKVVRSRDDLEEAVVLASNRRLINEAARDLGHHDPAEQQALARRRRIVLVDFMMFALARGHEAKLVAQAISDIVEHGAIAAGDLRDIRKTIAGDRIELVLALAAYAPDELERLRARITGTPAERIIEYADELRRGHENR